MYKDKPFHIGTVRFTNKTYQENTKWKERKNNKGCIYGLDTKITEKNRNGKSELGREKEKKKKKKEE